MKQPLILQGNSAYSILGKSFACVVRHHLRSQNDHFGVKFPAVFKSGRLKGESVVDGGNAPGMISKISSFVRRSRFRNGYTGETYPEDATIEAWVQPDPTCPEGARIFDKWATGSQAGFRLEIGAGGKLRFITTAPTVVDSEVGLPVGHASHVAATYSPLPTDRQVQRRFGIVNRLANGLPFEP
jgi:hypothetical protein